HGPTTIQYTIEDGNGGSDSATVTIDVVAVNDPPVANDDSASTPENTAITVDVLANDSDVDGALVPATVQIVGGPAHGSVVVNADGTVTYSPDANYNGPDSFSYTVADDGGGVSNAASVAVTTTPVEVPVFAEISVDQASVSEGGTLIYSVTLKDANGDPVPVAAGNMVEVALDWSGPASLGDDTSALPTSVTIVAGADSVDIAVVAIDDFLAEGSEALIATITAATDIGGSFDALLVGAVATASSAIVDDIGSEDPVFALVEGPETVAEGDTGSYLIKLVDGDGLPVSVPADTIVTVRFTNGTAEDDDYQYGDGLTADFTIPAGASTVSFPVSTVDDAVFEADEDFTVSIDSLATAAFERIDTSSTLTTRIIDDDSFAADGITGDDDDVNENVDSNVANDIIHQGTIGAVAEDVTLSIDTDVVGGFTSNGVPIGYAWDAGTRTLTATAGATLVFTVILSPANDSYSFQQFAAIDHPLLPGEDHSLDIPLSLLAHDDDGVQIASAPIALTIWDDAPEVTGTKTIVTANDGSHKETGTLTEVTVSNDITELAWDTSALPSLVFDGKPVQVIDHGDGRLTGELADGTLVFRVSIDPALVDANDSPQYSFELLNPLGRLGVEGTAESYTVITGGNIDTLALAFGNFLIDTMTATASDGSSATVNTNNSWIGIGGNWFDPSEVLFMDFTDPSGADGEVRGLDMVVEGQGGAPYELQWTVTAAIDLAGNTISYSGSVSGAGNGDLPFQIGLQDGALYFTDVTITDVSGNFRVAFALLTANDYESGIPLELGYVLTDADGDVATGILDIDLTAATGVSLTGGNDADSLVGTSSDDQIFGLGGNDLLVGGAGSDHLDGGSGDDRILGGSGDDELLGGLGADTFAWSLADSGASGSPNQDSILDFDTAASGGDILDLHDLLQGESGATLTDFLHFEQTASGTVLHVSKNGGFAGGYSAAQENLAISLDGVDLFGGGLTTDQQVIQDLLSKGKLITD
ncbi:MAG: tandem-95 repeat protein, partial [Rhodocyclaceae bacterium]|nr:tandem-95 repeat protein [Rhodocyclaceae bacterium]